MKRNRVIAASRLLAIAVAGIGCGNEAQDTKVDPFAQVSAGKGDMVSSAHIIDNIDLDSRIDGRFSDRIRVYGFTVEAKKGATLAIDIVTKAGANSSDVAEGEPLDTVAAIYGPMVGDDRGAKLAQSEDDPFGGPAAELPPVAIAEDGRYTLLMASWSDPGSGSYQIEVDCQGTDFQCRRPLQVTSCAAETRYITGGTVIGTETWNNCKVVLLEQVHVAESAILTIDGGVTVQGNYVGTGEFGTVDLVVDGSLQAVGTAEHPVVFTGLKQDKGWKGLVLNGNSNTIQHAFVEKAEYGIRVLGSNNTFSDLNINSGRTAMTVGDESHDNKVHRLKISQVDNGLDITGAIDIFDSIIVGRGLEADTGSGIRGKDSTGLSRFHRALVAGFGHGLHLFNTELEVYDSTIVNNVRGAVISGADSGFEYPYTCPAFPRATAPPPVWRPAPTTWGRDPVFIRCDIIKNSEYAVKVRAPELVVIENSNVSDNGAGILIESHSLHDDSRITANNIFRNGDPVQIESHHINGTLDISGNYWAQLSDPELSSSWNMRHESTVDCTESRNPANHNCTRSGNGYTCGAYACTWTGSRWHCVASITARQNGQFTFTGFSPMALPAGPDLSTCTDDVKQARQQQGL